ncbi:MAG TPA: hypothetical protein VF614_03715 [Chthoniobacteraceae bacterium]
MRRRLAPLNSHPSTLNSSHGFTLFEVMIAVFMTVLITFSLFRFVSANLDALRFSTENAAEGEAIVGLINLVQGQLNELPVVGQALLTGKAQKFKGLASDEMQWRTKAGVGVLTTAARGDYQVTLMLQPPEKTSARLDLGLRRRPTAGTDKDEQWMRLIENFAAMEIRYFDPRINSWLERWQDQNVRPSLVRIRLWRRADDEPYEAVLNIPAALTQQ